MLGRKTAGLTNAWAKIDEMKLCLDEELHRKNCRTAGAYCDAWLSSLHVQEFEKNKGSIWTKDV